jgi:hypothetical protein
LESITAVVHTRKVPWVALVDVDLGDDWHRARDGGRLVHEVVNDELLVCGVEPKTSRKTRHAIAACHGQRVRKWELAKLYKVMCCWTASSTPMRKEYLLARR